MLSEQLLGPLEASLTTSAPMCSTCAFEPFCGADPVYHHTTQGDPVGHKAFSDFCSRNMGIFTTLLQLARDDPFSPSASTPMGKPMMKLTARTRITGINGPVCQRTSGGSPGRINPTSATPSPASSPQPNRTRTANCFWNQRARTALAGRSAPSTYLPNCSTSASGTFLAITPDGRRVSVLWKSTARHNSLLLTEQCDNLCLMCSQPPKTRDDAHLFRRAKKVIDLLPASATGIGLTGGEPTLNEDALIDLLQHCARVRPALPLHLLSNGRRFARRAFTARYAAVGLQDIMVGIPLYAPEPGLHDYVVQAGGAFAETVRGMLNLAALHQRFEIRIVIQKHTASILPALADYIVRNLPFVSQVALMGLEMTGLALRNSPEVWIDPADYRSELHEAATTLKDSGILTKIFNHQLCVLDHDLWPLAVQSISDWKNDYTTQCSSCAVKHQCGGIFTTSHGRISKHLIPIVS